MSSNSPVILYSPGILDRGSPFSIKIESILALKGISHERVEVSPVVPRPELSDLLGLPYRRIPLLSIGNDVYCDTYLIANTLERRFPPSQGFPSIFPQRKTGGNDASLQRALAFAWIDRTLAGLSMMAIPWSKLPGSFIEDRSKFTGSSIDPKKLEALQPSSMSTLVSHLLLVEDQLNDGREWLFDTVSPGLADATLHYVLTWIRGFPAAKSVFDPSTLPKTIQWLNHMTTYLVDAEKQTKFQYIKGLEAAQRITSSNFEDVSNFKSSQVEMERLNVKPGSSVAIAPDDTGRKYPAVGNLVLLNREVSIIETHGTVGKVRAHFPRLGYTVSGLSKAKL